MSTAEKIFDILRTQLRSIYGERMLKLEVTDTMPYPMKEDLYLVRYNINLENELPIRRAQIVVDIKNEELRKFEPGLL